MRRTDSQATGDRLCSRETAARRGASGPSLGPMTRTFLCDCECGARRKTFWKARAGSGRCGALCDFCRGARLRTYPVPAWVALFAMTRKSRAKQQQQRSGPKSTSRILDGEQLFLSGAAAASDRVTLRACNIASIMVLRLRAMLSE